MEPSTPPRSSRSRDFLATPATPRFGSFGDLTDEPRKPTSANSEGEHSTPRHAKHNLHASTRTPHRRKRSLNALATPRQTPRKRQELDDHTDENSRIRVDTNIMQKLRAPETRPVQPHPHQDAPPPDVPGMWYVFRGKKVFRPLPPGEKPIQPVTLFKEELDAKRRAKQSRSETILDFGTDSGSEADTDKEWD